MNSPMEKRHKNWSYNEGRALIRVYENRKEEFFKTLKKIDFWKSILVDLEALDVLESTTSWEQVEQKWRSLYRAYKNAKDRGTGSTPSKFMHMREMDDVYHDNPSVSVGLVATVGARETPQSATCSRSRSKSKSPRKASPKKRPGKSPRKVSPKKRPGKSPRKASPKKRPKKESLLDFKKQNYNDKMELKNKTKEVLQNYLNRKEESRERRHAEIMARLNKNVMDI